MFKHWALNHPESVSAPKFVFKVVKKHKDVLSRMVHEAILIGKHASMNSKSEWRGFQVKRLTVEKTDWQTKKELDQGEARAKVEKGLMNALKERAASVRSKSVSNISLNSRKGVCRKILLCRTQPNNIRPQ